MGINLTDIKRANFVRLIRAESRVAEMDLWWPWKEAKCVELPGWLLVGGTPILIQDLAVVISGPLKSDNSKLSTTTLGSHESTSL